MTPFFLLVLGQDSRDKDRQTLYILLFMIPAVTQAYFFVRMRRFSLTLDTIDILFSQKLEV